MIIYNPNNEQILTERIRSAEEILDSISAKYCFITGSYLYKKKYNDIDVFVITRSKKKFVVNNKKVKITVIDFNDLHSLFYHSISKCCLAKEVLPQKSLKVTISDYWQVINEAVPTILNQKNKYHKEIRYLVLYTEFFKNQNVLDTYQLNQIIKNFRNYKQILKYIDTNVPSAINKNTKKSYLKKFFYTQAGFYKDVKDKYDAQEILYDLTHAIVRGVVHG